MHFGQAEHDAGSEQYENVSEEGVITLPPASQKGQIPFTFNMQSF